MVQSSSGVGDLFEGVGLGVCLGFLGPGFSESFLGWVGLGSWCLWGLGFVAFHRILLHAALCATTGIGLCMYDCFVGF